MHRAKLAHLMQSYALLLECALAAREITFYCGSCACRLLNAFGLPDTASYGTGAFRRPPVLAVILTIRAFAVSLRNGRFSPSVLAIRTGIRRPYGTDAYRRRPADTGARCPCGTGASSPSSFTVRTLILIVLPIGTLLAGRLTVGALRLLLCRFSGLDPALPLVFSALSLCFLTPLRDWMRCVLFAELLRRLPRTPGCSLRQLIQPRTAASADVRSPRNDRAAGLADRRCRVRSCRAAACTHGTFAFSA